jgi:CDP-glucose 4,6-dehydratase
MSVLSFFDRKRVLVTGHTGFKGTWLSRILVDAGADVTGYSLEPPTHPNLFEISGVAQDMRSVIGDIRDLSSLQSAFELSAPEIVIHLAAQPIVREGYRDPRQTFETNVMGTVNVLECVRKSTSARSFLNVTTDKVYENKEWTWGYRENEPLDGYDPYSNSKSCSELVTHSYKSSFFHSNDVAISTARAGNVIGGGDFAADRIIPDCVRSVMRGKSIIVRNPESIRPYQHVLEPLFAYLLIVGAQFENGQLAGWYNVGPDDIDAVTTGTLVDLFCEIWGDGACWENHSDGGPHEASFLKLDCSKLKSTFQWKPQWHIRDAVQQTVEWTRAWERRQPVVELMRSQIKLYAEGMQ